MIALDLDNKDGLHPLPGHLADRVLSQSEHTGFDDLDRQLVLLSKRCFIVTNALTSGTDEQILDKLALFKDALQEYLLINEQHIYLPLCRQDKAHLPMQLRTLILEFLEMKKRLLGFISQDPKAALSHRLLTAKAVCRIDHLIVERCAVEHELLYPALINL